MSSVPNRGGPHRAIAHDYSKMSNNQLEGMRKQAVDNPHIPKYKNRLKGITAELHSRTELHVYRNRAQEKPPAEKRYVLRETDTGHEFVDLHTGTATNAHRVIPGLPRKPNGISSKTAKQDVKDYNDYQGALRAKLREMNSNN